MTTRDAILRQLAALEDYERASRAGERLKADIEVLLGRKVFDDEFMLDLIAEAKRKAGGA
jgi:hypothetical protein